MIGGPCYSEKMLAGNDYCPELCGMTRIMRLAGDCTSASSMLLLLTDPVPSELPVLMEILSFDPALVGKVESRLANASISNTGQ
jgi:hypothetical protein